MIVETIIDHHQLSSRFERALNNAAHLNLVLDEKIQGLEKEKTMNTNCQTQTKTKESPKFN